MKTANPDSPSPRRSFREAPAQTPRIPAAHSDWEDTHFRYLIRTFWLGLIGTVIGTVLLIVLIGFLVWLAVGVLVIVRCVLSLINAQKQQPMPNPDTWLA